MMESKKVKLSKEIFERQGRIGSDAFKRIGPFTGEDDLDMHV